MDDTLQETADLSAATGEELVKRGEALLALGRRLLAQSDALNAVDAGLVPASTAEPSADGDEPYSVSKRGDKIRFGEAIQVAKSLGTFTRKEFEEATQLRTIQASKWLNILINNKPPIIERTMESRGRANLYRYLPIEGNGPTSRVSHARAVDAASGVGADAPVRGAARSFTGRPRGASGKPGRDKKLSKTRRIRRKSGQIIGGS